MTMVSVIIPAWCEASRIGVAVARARELGDEVIVADAASPDGTAAQAAAHGARLVQAPKGRGAQLRAGAAAASGDVLVFMHADVHPEPGARAALLAALRDPAVIGGNFRLVFAGRSRWAQLFTVGNDLRRRLFRVYYGDSLLFVRRSVYRTLGGFRPYPIFEDYDFARRMERCARGRTVYVREVCVRASARRFEDAPLRTLLNWTVLHGLYSLANVPPTTLARWYADVRERASAGELEPRV